MFDGWWWWEVVVVRGSWAKDNEIENDHYKWSTACSDNMLLWMKGQKADGNID